MAIDPRDARTPVAVDLEPLDSWRNDVSIADLVAADQADPTTPDTFDVELEGVDGGG